MEKTAPNAYSTVAGGRFSVRLRPTITHSSRPGFTIIEVLIVLAIAGLIMIIVFLAVPALQRNSRNTGRKNDIGRIASAINSFVSNSGGALPKGVNWNADCTTIVDDAGNLNQLTSIICPPNSTPFSSTPTANTFYEKDAGFSLGQNPVANVLLLNEQTVCSGSSATTSTGATSRSAALLYTRETGSGWAYSCLNIQ